MTYDARAFQLVTVDTMGPISPQALGGYNFVTKFVDQHTKWKDIVLIKEKKQTVDSLELFNKGLVIPTDVRFDRLKADNGTEFTNSALKPCCCDTDMKLQFASPNTPQQIGANERAGKTIAGIVRCLLADSGLPKSIWRELMVTAVYLSDRASHAVLANATPYKTLYGKDFHLGHLRAIGARAFVHVETHTKKLDRAWEGRLVGYSVDRKSFRVYNPASRSVRESINITFTETPSVMREPDLVSGFDEGDFTYDEYDGMERDVRSSTSNLDLSSHPAVNREVQDPPVWNLLQTFRETTNRDAAAIRNSSDPPETPPVESIG